MRLELGTPVERELVFVHDRPREGNRSGLTTIIRDGAVCRMYYCGSQLDLHEGGYRIPHNYTCYAESGDGLAWTRPELGLVDLPDGEPNNAILSGQPPLTYTPFLVPGHQPRLRARAALQGAGAPVRPAVASRVVLSGDSRNDWSVGGRSLSVVSSR